MQMNVQHHTERSIVHIAGDFLSEPDQEKFRSRIREMVGKGNREIVIDLSGVHHINSCGLGALICALTTVKKSSGELALTGVGKELQEVFLLTKLDSIFPTYNTTAEAVSSLHGHPH